MHPMRELMTLNEAPRKTPIDPKLDHAQRVQQEAARQAAELVAIKQQATALQARAKTLATQAVRGEFFGPWEQDWINACRAEIRKLYDQRKAANKEEYDFEREDNPEVKLVPVNFYECVTEGIAGWWDRQKDSIDWSDGRYRLEDYFDSHPKTESSDDMSRLQGEDEMLKYINYFGGFGSIIEMDKTLGYIDSYLDNLQRYSDNGWSHPGESVTKVIKAGLPIILFFCKTLEAIK
jgi:hypothetical protein